MVCLKIATTICTMAFKFYDSWRKCIFWQTLPFTNVCDFVWVFFWANNHQNWRVVYTYRQMHTYVAWGRYPPHTLFWRGCIAVLKWQKPHSLPLPCSAYKTFLLSLTKMKQTYATLQEKGLKDFWRVPLKGLYSPCSASCRPSCCSSHVEAVTEMFKPVEIIQMNYSVFQGVMNWRQDISWSLLLNTTIWAYAWCVHPSHVNWKPGLLTPCEIKLPVKSS